MVGQVLPPLDIDAAFSMLITDARTPRRRTLAPADGAAAQIPGDGGRGHYSLA
jgi:hypothetical protein